MSNIPTLIAQIEKALQQIENKENIDFNKAIIRSACIDMFHSVEKLGLEKGEYPVSYLRLDHITNEESATFQYNSNIEKSAPEAVDQNAAEIPTNDTIENHSVIVPETPIEQATISIEKPKNTEPQVPLVEKLNKTIEPVINVVDKQKETPIADIVKAISISKKFEFINTLFDGQADVYKNSIQTIQEANSYEDATQFIDTTLSQQFNWNEHEKLAAEFFSLVRRRFL